MHSRTRAQLVHLRRPNFRLNHKSKLDSILHKFHQNFVNNILYVHRSSHTFTSNVRTPIPVRSLKLPTHTRCTFSNFSRFIHVYLYVHLIDRARAHSPTWLRRSSAASAHIALAVLVASCRLSCGLERKCQLPAISAQKCLLFAQYSVSMKCR